MNAQRIALIRSGAIRPAQSQGPDSEAVRARRHEAHIATPATQRALAILAAADGRNKQRTACLKWDHDAPIRAEFGGMQESGNIDEYRG